MTHRQHVMPGCHHPFENVVDGVNDKGQPIRYCYICEMLIERPIDRAIAAKHLAHVALGAIADGNLDEARDAVLAVVAALEDEAKK